eukprot:3935828-Rhodomonas_salina.2
MTLRDAEAGVQGREEGQGGGAGGGGWLAAAAEGVLRLAGACRRVQACAGVCRRVQACAGVCRRVQACARVRARRRRAPPGRQRPARWRAHPQGPSSQPPPLAISFPQNYSRSLRAPLTCWPPPTFLRS